MPTNRKTKASSDGASKSKALTLADVLNSLGQETSLSATRLRDLQSAVKRVADLLGDVPAAIPLDLPAIGTKLANVNPITVGVSAKTLANLRSGFLTAIKVSGLKLVQRSAKTPLSPAWVRLMGQLSGKRAHLGLSRLARYASANRIEPNEINDAAIEDFIAAVRAGSLHRNPNDLHRKVTLIWNEVAKLSGLQTVTVASFRAPAKRVDWTQLTRSFQKDVDRYLEWCRGADVFAADARSRALAPQTVQLRRNQIHAAVTALVESGVRPSAITSLADLVSPEKFKRILRRRHETVDGRENVFNGDLARALVRIAAEWVKVDAGVIVELTRLAGKVPVPMPGLTVKNKRTLGQFDDPAVLQRLYNFSSRLWAEVKRDGKPNFRTLVKAQAALAVAILSYMPIRLQNLAALTFDLHLFLHEAPNATSSLELAAGEVKNRREMAFDIPPLVAKMLMEYRNCIAPSVIGRRPDRLFVKADGSPKNQWSVAWLIRKYLKRRAGIALSPHQFRHLSAKVVLDAEPGNFETPREFLGHKRVETTATIYAGISSRRAARHHQRLVEQALAAEKPASRPKGPAF